MLGATLSHMPVVVEVFYESLWDRDVAHLAHIYKCSSIWSAFGLSFSKEGSQDKCGIESTTTAPKAKLLIPKKMILLSCRGHQATHSHGHKAEEVGGDSN